MIKTLNVAGLHFAVAFFVGYLMTGSLLVGGTLAPVEPAVNTITCQFHEQAWNRRRSSPQTT